MAKVSLLAFCLAQAVAFTSAITTLDWDIWHHCSNTLSVAVLPDHSCLFKTADDVQWNVGCTQPCSRDGLSTVHIHSQVPEIVHQCQWLQYIVSAGLTAGFLLIKMFWVICKKSTGEPQYNTTFAGLALAMLKTHCFVMLCIKTALSFASLSKAPLDNYVFGHFARLSLAKFSAICFKYSPSRFLLSLQLGQSDGSHGICWCSYMAMKTSILVSAVAVSSHSFCRLRLRSKLWPTTESQHKLH